MKQRFNSLVSKKSKQHQEIEFTNFNAITIGKLYINCILYLFKLLYRVQESVVGEFIVIVILIHIKVAHMFVRQRIIHFEGIACKLHCILKII